MAALALAGAAQAEVYRCSVDGHALYTDKACAAGTPPAELPGLTTTTPGARAGPARRPEGEASRRAAEVRKVRDEEVDAYAARKASADALRKGVVENRVVPGMTPDQVKHILNLPTRIDGQGGESERWTYINGNERRVVIFKHGVVAGDGEARKGKKHQ